MVIRSTSGFDNSDEEEDSLEASATTQQEQQEQQKQDSPAPEPPEKKKKKTLNRPANIVAVDPDAPSSEDAPTATTTTTTNTTSTVKETLKEVVAGAMLHSKTSKGAAASSTEDAEPCETKNTSSSQNTDVFVSVDDGKESDDGDTDFGNDDNEPGKEVSAAKATPLPQQSIDNEHSSQPAATKTDEFGTELIENVAYLVRGAKKKKKGAQQSNLYDLRAHLVEEGLTLEKAEFVLDPAVPVELGTALSSSEGDEDGRGRTILPIEMPFDVFIHGDEEKFFAALCENDTRGRQKIMAATLIAKNDSDSPVSVCYFVRLKVTQPDEAGSLEVANCAQMWNSLQEFMGEETVCVGDVQYKNREIVIPLDTKVVQNIMVTKQANDAVFFVPHPIISFFQTKRSKKDTKTFAYKKFDTVNTTYVFSISGDAGGKKRTSIKSSSKQKVTTSAAASSSSTQPARKSVVGSDDDDDDLDVDDDEDTAPASVKKIKPSPDVQTPATTKVASKPPVETTETEIDLTSYAEEIDNTIEQLSALLKDEETSMKTLQAAIEKRKRSIDSLTTLKNDITKKKKVA